ncbi:MAG: hypothetical protein ACYC6O_07730 [Thermoleophilia bacterium]
MGQTTRNRYLSYLVMAAVVLVTAGMLIVIFTLKARAETGYSSEGLAHSIESNCNALNALEWQAIAMQDVEAGIMKEIDERRDDVSEALDTLEQRSPDAPELEKMRETFDRYKNATDEEFALISSGRIPEALEIDEESVDTLFERLVEMATETATANHERAVSDNNLSYYLIAMICLLTVMIAGILLWLYYRLLRKNG